MLSWTEILLKTVHIDKKEIWIFCVFCFALPFVSKEEKDVFENKQK